MEFKRLSGRLICVLVGIFLACCLLGSAYSEINKSTLKESRIAAIIDELEVSEDAINIHELEFTNSFQAITDGDRYDIYFEDGSDEIILIEVINVKDQF